VQWREEGRGSKLPVADVREIYLWDLQGSAVNLTGVLQYTLRQGVLPSLVIALPENVEVRRLEALALPGSKLPAPRLKEWDILETAGGRQVQIHFQTPLSKGVQILLELVATDRVGTSVVVSLPTPKEVAGSEGFLAYRVAGRKSSLVDYRRVTGLAPAVFASLWRSALADDPRPLANAYHFRP